jgi:hypothetical protein
LRKENLMKKQRKLIMLSNLLLNSLKRLNRARLMQIQTLLKDFNNKCVQATKDSHLFDTAVEKGWLIGAESIRSRIERNLNDFSHHVQKFKELVNTDETVVPNFIDVFAELTQAEQEYDELQFDLESKAISITTGDIVLEDISFGPFEIRLFINKIEKLYTDVPYSVIALEPNPAGGNDSVTHPHVSDEMLCEGDGHVAIRNAIEQGRICDFFTLITNILKTYNSSSPYVSLDDWQGRSCYDCGYSISEDESYYCETCEQEYCAQCSTYCRTCDTTVCLGCSSECQGCNEPVCKGCMHICKECEETFCENCINENGLCENCQAERNKNENDCSEKTDAEV